MSRRLSDEEPLLRDVVIGVALRATAEAVQIPPSPTSTPWSGSCAMPG